MAGRGTTTVHFALNERCNYEERREEDVGVDKEDGVSWNDVEGGVIIKGFFARSSTAVGGGSSRLSGRGKGVFQATDLLLRVLSPVQTPSN